MSDEIRRAQKERRALRIYAAVTTVISCLALVGATRALQRTAAFDTITAHKIVIADSDGTTRLIIANRENYPPPVERGKLLDPKNRNLAQVPVMMFYNRDGSEQGAISWDGAHDDKGGHQRAGISFDQLETNDNLILAYGEREGNHHAGLYGREQSQKTSLPDLVAQMNAAVAAGTTKAAKDSITKKFVAEHFAGNDRFSIGYDTDGSSVRLNDPQGRLRLLLTVDSTGTPKIQFYDASGHVSREVTGI